MRQRMNLTVPDVLSEVGISTRQGKALCPLHGEKTPSFTFTDDLWYCFGCGDGGNAWQLAIRLGVRQPTRKRVRVEPGQRVVGGLDVAVLDPSRGRPGPYPSETLRRAVRSRQGALRGLLEECLGEVDDWKSLAADLYRVAPYRIDVREVAMETVCRGLEVEQRYRGRYEGIVTFETWLQGRRTWA